MMNEFLFAVARILAGSNVGSPLHTQSLVLLRKITYRMQREVYSDNFDAEEFITDSIHELPGRFRTDVLQEFELVCAIRSIAAQG